MIEKVEALWHIGKLLTNDLRWETRRWKKNKLNYWKYWYALMLLWLPNVYKQPMLEFGWVQYYSKCLYIV